MKLDILFEYESSRLSNPSFEIDNDIAEMQTIENDNF